MTRIDDKPRRTTRMTAPPPEEPARLPAAIDWLRPLARAPAAMREIAARVERVTGAPVRAIPAPLAKVPPLLASFIVLVLAPSVAAALYFALLAADQYTVESRFSVRSVEPEAAETGSTGGGGGSPVGGFSFTATGQNAYIVTSYIRSRGIIDDLATKIDLREVFHRPEADFWARLKRDPSIEELVDYWNSMVDTYVDSVSSIVILRIRAFRREDALVLGQLVIEASEGLVNRISDRARRDSTAQAEMEVRRSFGAVREALAALNAFRDTSGMLDPGQASGEIAKLLVPLVGEKIKIEDELFVLRRELSEDAPTVRVLREKLGAVEAHIKEYEGKLTSEGGANRTISSSLAKFEELEVQRLLAERFYMLAQADLDRAQLRASRQNVYLSVFVPPSLPEESHFPRRWAFSILTFIGLAIFWSIGAMVLASIDDHRL
ncbi:MAG TPA: capsule biosynthesis protein [Methylocystis sp.]|nr:capsule biosynthesis protein [Methylocystis sp.]